jgi:Ca2+-binding RTX toxin-like protein
MSIAKIEIKSKPIPGSERLGKFAPHHLFIIYTDSLGQEIALRGGPGTPDFKGAFLGNIKVTKQKYDNNHIDYYKDAPAMIIATGTDAEMQSYVDKMQERGKKINEGEHDYKISLLPGHEQNSNTVIRILVETAGLKAKLPQFKSGEEVWAPSFYYTIKDTPYDIKSNGKYYLKVNAGDPTKASWIHKKTEEKVLTVETGLKKHSDGSIRVLGPSKEAIIKYYNIHPDLIKEASTGYESSKKLTDEERAEYIHKVPRDKEFINPVLSGERPREFIIVPPKSPTTVVETHSPGKEGKGQSDTSDSWVSDLLKEGLGTLREGLRMLGESIDRTTDETFTAAENKESFSDQGNTADTHRFGSGPWRGTEPSTSSREYKVKSGDTVWKIAKDHGMGVDELLSVSGNEYLQQHRYQDDFGRDNIRIQPGHKVYVPNAHDFSSYVWQRQSNYGSPIETTSGLYDFLSPFNKGSYSSVFSLDKYLYFPFNGYGNSHFYNKDYAVVMDSLRGVEFTSWRQDDFSKYSQDYSKEYGEEKFKAREGGEREGSFHMPRPEYSGRQYSNPVFSSQGFNFDRYSKGYEIVYGDDSVALRGKFGELSFGRGGDGLDMFGTGTGFKVLFPIVLDLNNDGKIQLINLKDSQAFYDIDGSGFLKNLGWIGKEDGVLAIDINGDKAISLPREISFKLWHKDAKTDLDGLRLAFDKNKDGKLDKQDPKYKELLIWRDYNQNAISEAGEVTSLADAGIEAILLNQKVGISSSTSQGNKIFKAVSIQKNGKKVSGAYDVAFEYSDVGIAYEEDYGKIILKYGDNTKVKIYRVEDKTGEVVDLRGKDYKVVIGNKGKDVITATDQNTAIDGYEGDDILVGGKGNDWLKGGEGSDVLKGGKGHDILFIDNEDKQENIDGGEDTDVALVSTPKGVTLDLARANIEAVYGNRGNDHFKATNSKVGVYLDGGKGDDFLEGSAYDDIIVGGPGKDKIHAGKGNDSIFIDAEGDTINAGEGKDSVFIYGSTGVSLDAGKASAEYVFGSLGNDYLYSSGKDAVVLVGNDGDDRLVGGEGDDVLDGGKGNDLLEGKGGSNRYVFYLGAGHDVITSNSGKDYLLLYSSIKRENLVFKKEGLDLKLTLKDNDKDSVTVKSWYDTLKSHKLSGFVLDADTDTSKSIVFKDEGDNNFRMENDQSCQIFTMHGNDKVGGGDKDDFINGGEGNDEIIGWEGNDILVGGPGNDSLQGWSGDDIYLFNRGEGHDTIFDEYSYSETKQGVEKRKKVVQVPVWDRHCVSTPYGSRICSNPYIDRYVDKEVEYEVPYTQPVEIKGNGGTDTLRVGPGIKLQELLFKKTGDDLIVGIKQGDTPFDGLQDKVTIKSWAVDFNKVEMLEVEGVEISLKKISNFINVQGTDPISQDTSANDLIKGAVNQSSTIYSGGGDDIIVGDSKKDQIISDGGNDQLFGGDGDDELFSVKNNGKTTLFGGKGADTFVLTKKDTGSKDVILDFDTEEDSIEIRGDFKEKYSFGSLDISQADKDTIITLENNQQIILKNVQKEKLHSSKFEFTGEKHGSGTLKTEDSNYANCILYGAGENDELIADAVGWHMLRGGAGDDILRGGGGGISVLDGGRGNDSIYCHNKGKDILFYRAGFHVSGHDKVYNFDASTDKIKVTRAAEVDVFLKYSSGDGAGNTVFKGSDWSITLMGIDKSAITKDCFDIWEEV